MIRDDSQKLISEQKAIIPVDDVKVVDIKDDQRNLVIIQSLGPGTLLMQTFQVV